MNIREIKEKVFSSKEYDFLKTNKHLGNNIILIGLGGSYAYGTQKEDGSSDLDIRGVALNTKEEILSYNNFEQTINNETDTVIYSFNKIVSLLASCNPNVCELLGLKKEHYLYINPIGKELLDNAHMFLSKRAAHTFGGYALQQFRRMSNLCNKSVSQSEKEQFIFNTINNAIVDIKKSYKDFTEDDIKLYIDKAVQEGYDTEIFMDVNLKHYPLRDYCSIWNELKSIVSSYSKIGKRNEKAITHNKLGKHMMHLIRLYIMCLDILEKEQIVTYREKEHDFLMDIRNGKYLDDNDKPIPEFYEMVNEYEEKLNYAKQNTSLPEDPDYKKINEFVMDVNERVVNGKI